MIDVDAINKSVRGYVSLVTSLNVDTNVLKADQDAPIPKDQPYASVKVLLVGKEGHDEIDFEDQPGPDVDLVETREGERRVDVSINFFGTGALNNANKMLGAAYESANFEYLIANKLGFIDASDVRNLSEIDLSRYEERGQLDMFFYIIDNNSNIVSSVQSQVVETTFEESGTQYTNDIEVT